MQITKMVNSSVAANIPNGADSAATTEENTDGILVADKNVFGVEVHKIPTALEIYNIPIDTLGIAIPTSLEAYNVPTTLKVYNIPTTLEVYNIPGNALEVSSTSTAGNTLEVYHIPGNMLEVYTMHSKHKRKFCCQF